MSPICRKCRPLISAYLDGETSQAEEQFIRDHLKTCQECREAFRSYENIRTQFLTLARPSPSPALRQAVLRGVRAKGGRSSGYGVRRDPVSGVFGRSVSFGMGLVTAAIIFVIAVAVLIAAFVVPQKSTFDLVPMASNELPAGDNIVLKFTKPVDENEVIKHINADPPVDVHVIGDGTEVELVPRQALAADQTLKVNIDGLKDKNNEPLKDNKIQIQYKVINPTATALPATATNTPKPPTSTPKPTQPTATNTTLRPTTTAPVVNTTQPSTPTPVVNTTRPPTATVVTPQVDPTRTLPVTTSTPVTTTLTPVPTPSVTTPISTTVAVSPSPTLTSTVAATATPVVTSTVIGTATPVVTGTATIGATIASTTISLILTPTVAPTVPPTTLSSVTTPTPVTTTARPPTLAACAIQPVSGFGVVYNTISGVASKLGCPTEPRERKITIAYRAFENGFMFYEQDSMQVWVFFGRTTGTWQVYQNIKGSFPPPSDGPNPPHAGLYVPDNGFGKVWSENNLVGKLGWSTQPKETSSLNGAALFFENGIMLFNQNLDVSGGKHIYVLYKSDSTFLNVVDTTP